MSLRKRTSHAGQPALLEQGEAAETRPTITAIKPLPKNPSMRSIHVGRTRVALLLDTEVLDMGLAAGSRWTTDHEHLAAFLHQMRTGRSLALGWLAKGTIARARIIERLTKRGYIKPVAERIADSLEADGWLNDSKGAREVAERTLTRRGERGAAARARLTQRGFDDRTADAAVARALAARNDRADALDLARALARRNARLVQTDQRKAARRIFAALSRRGFDEDDSMSALAALGLLDSLTQENSEARS